LFYYERKFGKKGFNLIMGVDEAGRGPLAGPVVAAAVILKKCRFKNRIADSKKLTPLQRHRACIEIIHNSIFGLGVINEGVIDRLNILEAARLAMENAALNLLSKLRHAPDCRHLTKKAIIILVDGNQRLNLNYPCINIVKGDAKSRTIAAASILAKVTRDRIMLLYDRLYPQYGFLRHKGYPTRFHRNTLKQFGSSAIHRKTFSYVQ
jgi:ribonuclease HII